MKKKVLSIVLVAFLCFALLPVVIWAEADDEATVSDFTELQSALSNPLVTTIIVTREILLPDGTLNGNNKTVRAAVTGVDEQGIVQTGSSHSIFRIESNHTVAVENMTIMGGGRTAVLNFGSLTMENVTVTRSSNYTPEARLAAGGILNTGSSATLVLKSCAIIRNVAGYGGGLVNNGGIVVIDNSSLCENRSLSSGGGGGAIENNSSAKTYICNSVISNNSSSEIGGGINNYDSSLYIMNSTITGNVTTMPIHYGGGIGMNGGTLVTANALIVCNYSINEENPGGPVCNSGIKSFPGSDDTIHIIESVVGYSGDLDSMFAKLTQSGIITADGSVSDIKFISPVLLKKGILYYAPLEINSAAMSGYINTTYFNYSNLSDVKMSYKTKSNSNEVSLITHSSESSNCAPISKFIEGTDRVDYVFGASGSIPANDVNYLVRVLPSEGGIFTGGTVYGDIYPENTRVELVAIPDERHLFDGWKINDEQAPSVLSSTYTFTVNEDITLMPVFREKVSSFEVTPNAANLGVSSYNYQSAPSYTFEIENTGHLDEFDFTASESEYFDVSFDTSTSIEPGDTATFTVSPKSGLTVDEYEETITITSANDSEASFDVSFTVIKANPDVSPLYRAEVRNKTNLTLADVELPDGWTWNNPETAVVSGESYTATYIPEDTDNYNTLNEDIAVTVTPCTHKRYSEWKSNNNAKFLCNGTKTHTCLRCGETETVTDFGSAGWFGCPFLITAHNRCSNLVREIHHVIFVEILHIR